jgi:hypothetical protein
MICEIFVLFSGEKNSTKTKQKLHDLSSLNVTGHHVYTTKRQQFLDVVAEQQQLIATRWQAARHDIGDFVGHTETGGHSEDSGSGEFARTVQCV